MLCRKSFRVTMIGTCFLYLLLLIPAIGLDLSLRNTEEAFMGIGGQLLAVFSTVVFFIATMSYKGIGEELQSGRVRLWVTAPVSRDKYYSSLFARTVGWGYVVSVLLFTVPVVVFPMLCHYRTVNLLQSELGIVQIAFVLIAFSIAGNSILHSKYIPVISMVFPMIVLIVYLRSVMSFASPTTVTVCNVLFPVGIGYTNTASGHLPAPSSGIEIIGAIQRQSSVAEDVYPFVWSAVLIFVSLLKLTNFRLFRRMRI